MEHVVETIKKENTIRKTFMLEVIDSMEKLMENTETITEKQLVYETMAFVKDNIVFTK